MKKYIGIDIGGTSIKHGIFDENANLLVKDELPTEALRYGGPGIVEKVKKIVRQYLEQDTAEGICISTAGMVDYKKGRIFYSSSLIPDYAGTNLKEIMETEFHIPCEVENDVNCAGLAESISGAGKNANSCLCLTVGTGIGGCLILNKEVFHGFSNSACEVGYMLIDGEAYQDTGASKVLVQKVEKRKGLQPGSMNGKMVFEQAKQGDRICEQAIDEMADILGKGIANICYVVNPEVVILGGGIMEQKEYLYHKIKSAINKYLIPVISEKTALCFAEHKNNAGMLGAFYNFKIHHKM